MNNFEHILHTAKGKKIPLVVAAAEDKEVLSAIKVAVAQELIVPILIGDKEKICLYAHELQFDLSSIEIIDEKDIQKSSSKAVTLVHDKKSCILMKGLVDTSILLQAVLDKENGLRTGNKLSHAAVFDLKKYHKLLFVTDVAMNIAPTLDEKRQLINNVVPFAQSLGIALPKVAVICAKEKVDAKMIHTVEAQELVNMNRQGRIKNCVIAGPYALDIAISREAAHHKGISGTVAGDADIVLMPTIEAGNVLYKSLTFFADAQTAGLILGAAAPIVLTSRADSDETKLNSIALAVMSAVDDKKN